MKVAEDEVPVSPLSETPTQSIHQPAQTALRPFAQPKTRRPQQQHAQGHGRIGNVDIVLVKEAEMDMDVENAVDEGPQPRLGSPGDFGEAPFLRPWSGAAAAAEVEMGGV